MSAELKLCPFCGKEGTHAYMLASENWYEDHDDEDDIYPHTDSFQSVCSVHLGGCGASTGFGHKTEADAIAAWNTRAAPAQAMTDVTEAVFGNRTAQASDEVSNSVVRNFRSTDAADLMTNFCPRCGKRNYPNSIHTCTPPITYQD